MSKVFNALKWGISRGKGSQNFLGAKWIGVFLRRVSESKRRISAVRILSISPHYFLDRDDLKYPGISSDEYLTTTFDALIISRENIYRKILKPYLQESYKVLDYGCGPGFLAKVTAPHVEKIYAVDISAGAIACAKIVNAAEKIDYLVADTKGFDSIPDGSIDAVYSFAVIQHLTDQVFKTVLDNSRKILKPGGKLLLHIQLIDDIWKTEDEHRARNKVQDKIKYELGLHCFGRTEQAHRDLVAKHGFNDIGITKFEDFVPGFAAEVHSQRLLVARNGK